MQKIEIPLSLASSEVDWRRIELFKTKANVLIENWDDLPQKQYSASFSRDSNGKITGGYSPLPKEFRLKGLYVDFRHFYLKKSDVNLTKHANYLASLVKSEHYYKYVNSIKNDFLPDSSFLKFGHDKKINTEEVLNTYFNAEYFHTDKDKLDKSEQWQALMSEETARSAIFEIVMNSIYPIYNLYISTIVLTKNNLVLTCPEILT